MGTRTPLSADELGARLDALHEPSEEVDSYGTHKCGCTWDSGPYNLHCSTHNGEALLWDTLRLVHERLTSVIASHGGDQRLTSTAWIVGRILNEGVEPPT